MSEQCTQCGSPLNTAGGCMTCTDHLMNTLVVDMFGSPEQKKDVELATLKSRNAELEAELEQESIFRNELKLKAMGWQDEPEENCHLCNCTEYCGNELLEFIVAHEATEEQD